VSEWYDSQKKPTGYFHKLLQERIDKASPHRKDLTKEETTKLAKLEATAANLKRGKNVQNRQLQTWLRETVTRTVAVQKKMFCVERTINITPTAQQKL
jgi:hypothetical protein